jgi:hypothetical protein
MPIMFKLSPLQTIRSVHSQIGTSALLLISIGVLLWSGIGLYQINQFRMTKQKVLGSSAEIRPSTPFPKASLKATPTPSDVGTLSRPNIASSSRTNSDLLTTCNFTYLGAKQMKTSECVKTFECQIGNQWVLYTSREQCAQDQKAYAAQKQAEADQAYLLWKANNTITAPNFGSSSYTPIPLATAAPVPTISPDQARALLDQALADINRCKNETNAYYNQQIRNCQTTLGALGAGDSSALDQCISAQNRARDNAIAACEN